MKFGYLIEIPSVADEIMERLSNNVVIGLIADAVVLQPIAFLSLFWPAVWDVCKPILLFLNAVLLLTALAYLIFALVYHLFFSGKNPFPGYIGREGGYPIPLPKKMVCVRRAQGFLLQGFCPTHYFGKMQRQAQKNKNNQDKGLYGRQEEAGAPFM